MWKLFMSALSKKIFGPELFRFLKPFILCVRLPLSHGRMKQIERGAQGSIGIEGCVTAHQQKKKKHTIHIRKSWKFLVFSFPIHVSKNIVHEPQRLDGAYKIMLLDEAISFICHKCLDVLNCLNLFKISKQRKRTYFNTKYGGLRQSL